MRTVVLWVTLSVMGVLPIAAQKLSQTGKGNESGKIEQQIRLLAKQGKEATLKGDASWIERNTTSDYVAVLAVGGMLPRETMIAKRKSGDLKYQSIDVVDQRVRTYGSTAILNETADIKATEKGHDISARYYVTQVWIKQDGGWKLANLQSTRAQQ